VNGLCMLMFYEKLKAKDEKIPQDPNDRTGIGFWRTQLALRRWHSLGYVTESLPQTGTCAVLVGHVSTHRHFLVPVSRST